MATKGPHLVSRPVAVRSARCSFGGLVVAVTLLCPWTSRAQQFATIGYPPAPNTVASGATYTLDQLLYFYNPPTLPYCGAIIQLASLSQSGFPVTVNGIPLATFLRSSISGTVIVLDQCAVRMTNFRPYGPPYLPLRAITIRMPSVTPRTT